VLRLTLHVTLGRTVLRLDEGRVIPRNTGQTCALPVVSLIIIKGDYLSLAEVCALLSAVLVFMGDRGG